MHPPRRSLSFRAAASLSVAAVVLSACSAPAQPAGASRGGLPDPSQPAGASEGSGPAAAASTIPRCDAVERVAAPAERYRDTPIYVANEQPVAEIRAWAAGQPGFEEIWIDRDHLGWITLAFSVDAERRQAELEQLFPDVGVVAVGVDWTMAELQALQERVSREIAPMFPTSSGISVTQGVVTIGVGVLKPERVAAIEERFAGEPVCIEGLDPADVPAEGPQPRGGDGWRLLADERAGAPYRTGIATDQRSYERLWEDIGLRGDPPPVVFESEVVIWFGAVFGSSCPNIRLDDVVVDRDSRLVHAEIVLVDPPMACTGDANPRAYLVALDRSRLPVGPFAIQLGENDPPPGAPEERTLVDVDLSRPGAAAGPGDVRMDPTPPTPFEIQSGSVIEPDVEYPYRFYVHCGIEWLGTFNDVAWRAELPPGNRGGVPSQWPAPGADQTVEVEIVLQTAPEPVIEATANRYTITYRPTAEDPPGCD